MTIVFQGRPVETKEKTIAGFLREMGVNAGESIVEVAREVVPSASGLASVFLEDGMEINVFKIVAGG